MTNHAVPPTGKASAADGMTLDDAIRSLRADPARSDLVRDAYLGRDVGDSARRFAASSEWAEVERLLDGGIRDATVVDVGAGTGIATAAFVRSGAKHVIAIEPDPSDEVGRGAMSRLGLGSEVEVVAGVGEGIPLPDAISDIVFCRQVLHHASDLDAMIREMTRVLRPGGVLLACREHVVDDDAQLHAFLRSHPVHRLAGGENAYSLSRYIAAFVAAGLTITLMLGPWESVINAFPLARTREDLIHLEEVAMSKRFGALGEIAARIPPVKWLVRRRLSQPLPGRLYSFRATKGETR